MAEIQQIDLDGLKNQFCSLYNIEAETEDRTYFFALRPVITVVKEGTTEKLLSQEQNQFWKRWMKNQLSSSTKRKRKNMESDRGKNREISPKV